MSKSKYTISCKYRLHTSSVHPFINEHECLFSVCICAILAERFHGEIMCDNEINVLHLGDREQKERDPKNIRRGISLTYIQCGQYILVQTAHKQLHCSAHTCPHLAHSVHNIRYRCVHLQCSELQPHAACLFSAVVSLCA